MGQAQRWTANQETSSSTVRARTPQHEETPQTRLGHPQRTGHQSDTKAAHTEAGSLWETRANAPTPPDLWITASRTPYENAAGQVPCLRVGVPQHPPGEDSRQEGVNRDPCPDF